MFKNKLSAIALIVATALSMHVNTAHAGGSSYAIRAGGKTAFVKSGQTVKELQRLHVESYFDEAYWGIRFIRIDRVTVDCSGDDVMKSANVSLSGRAYGSANFKQIPKKNNQFQAVIQLKGLVLENNAFYALHVNGTVRTQSSALRVENCRVSHVDSSASRDGKTYATTLTQGFSTYDVNDFYFAGDPSPSTVIVGNLRRFADSFDGAAFDLKRSLTGYIWGVVTKNASGGYRFTIQSWDKDAMDYVMTQHAARAESLFDVLRPTTKQQLSSDQYQQWDVQEVHFYTTPAANGAIGNVVLGEPSL